jgi:hypothetical protein
MCTRVQGLGVLGFVHVTVSYRELEIEQVETWTEFSYRELEIEQVETWTEF